MRKAIISLILLMTPLAPAPVLAADASALQEGAPDQYVVVRGDTLWGISGRFLKDAWRWPEVWRMNQEQLRNPHRIFPGDVIVLDREGAEVRLRLVRPEDAAAVPVPGAAPTPVAPRDTVKLSPRTRAEPLADKAIPAIPPSAIEPFLSRPLVVGRDELDSAPSVLATQENRVAIGAGSVAYAEGLDSEKGLDWQLFRRGDALIDPDTDETLGYQATYLGEARVIRRGNPATLEITKSAQEIYTGDRLLPAAKERPTFSYVPRAPAKQVRGRIMSIYPNNVGETGPLGIVALSKGSNDGLEVGHVLAIYRSQNTLRYATRMAPLYGRQGLSGSDSPRSYYEERITPRDAPLYERGRRITVDEARKLPDERYGLVMVFRTFDRASFGLVMNASRPVEVNDVVTNP
ncbi:MAG TPA: LysM peptidoglycan-binding domain-containing protein [Burkholderiales bacterium]|nr:LysM peptidoglycan-binding domain-containing protein [Burkholderiales bacterium]